MSGSGSGAAEERILAASDVSIAPIRLTWPYQLGLFAVAMLMLLLPLIYLGVIVMVGYGTWQYAVAGMALIAQMDKPPVLVTLVVYVTPLVAGPTAMLFMVKPLFAPRLQSRPPQVLTPEDEPLLHRFLEQLASAVHAPAPREVAISMDVNASASLRRGMASLFSKDLTLTVGLPLVAGLSLNQLAGVLAHELGHFSQGFAMRFGYLIHQVNAWFARVVYERDAWDRKLEEFTETSGPVHLLAVVAFSRLMVWASRRLLWLLMVTGHGVSAFLSRQMEYNADEHQARLVGSKMYHDTHVRIHLLSVAMEQATAHLQEMWGERRLVDDLVAYMSAEVDRLSGDAAARERIEAALLDAKSGFFDTHPSPRDRLRRAAALNASGHLSGASPARELFRDFDGLSERLTLDLYRQLIGEEVDEGRLMPTSYALSEHQRREAALGALSRFFLDVPLVQLGVYPPGDGLQAEVSPEVRLAALHDAREQMPGAVAAAVPDIEKLFAADERRRLVKLGLALGSAGVKFKPEQLNLTSHEQAALERELAETEALLAGLRERLAPAMRLAWARLEASLTLLDRPASALPWNGVNGDVEQTVRLVKTLAALGGVSVELRTLRWLFEELGPLLEMAGQHPANEGLQRQAVERSNAAYVVLRELQPSLSGVPYPFPYGNGSDVTVAAYAMPMLPEQSPGAVLEVAAGVRWRIGALYGRIWSELASTAERVEEGLGLEPLPPISCPLA